jgi:hypothetical protein
MTAPEKVPFSIPDAALDNLVGDRLDRLRAAIDSGDKHRVADELYELDHPAPGFASGAGSNHENVVPLHTPDSRHKRHTRHIDGLLRDIRGAIRRFVVLPGVH